jgi:hypothetical protein
MIGETLRPPIESEKIHLISYLFFILHAYMIQGRMRGERISSGEIYCECALMSIRYLPVAQDDLNATLEYVAHDGKKRALNLVGIWLCGIEILNAEHSKSNVELRMMQADSEVGHKILSLKQ